MRPEQHQPASTTRRSPGCFAPGRSGGSIRQTSHKNLLVDGTAPAVLATAFIAALEGGLSLVSDSPPHRSARGRHRDGASAGCEEPGRRACERTTDRTAGSLRSANSPSEKRSPQFVTEPVRTRPRLSNARALPVKESGGGGAPRKHPVRAHEVTGVASRVCDQVVLVLGLGLPERPCGLDRRHGLARPQA
jgi:hypothetical protein